MAQTRARWGSWVTAKLRLDNTDLDSSGEEEGGGEGRGGLKPMHDKGLLRSKPWDLSAWDAADTGYFGGRA